MEKIFLEKRDFTKLKIDNFLMDNGDCCEMFLPEKSKDRLTFFNEHCEFKPVGWMRCDFGWIPLGYKVVTMELESLSLRNNPTPLKFPVGKWIFEKNELQHGNEDWGGIWTALRESSIKTLKKHCLSTWDLETRGFLTAIFNPVFSNSYRIKSEGVMLLKEIKNLDSRSTCLPAGRVRNDK